MRVLVSGRNGQFHWSASLHQAEALVIHEEVSSAASDRSANAGPKLILAKLGLGIAGAKLIRERIQKVVAEVLVSRSMQGVVSGFRHDIDEAASSLAHRRRIGAGEYLHALNAFDGWMYGDFGINPLVVVHAVNLAEITHFRFATDRHG